MSSLKKPQNKHCSRHIFSLKAKSQTCFYQQPISLKFCNESNLKSKSLNSNISACYEGPIFNGDKNFLTSSFIMSSQKKKYVQNGSRCLSDQNKYQNLNEEKSQLFIPKPNSKHMHCNVCKEKYQDYQQHILQQKHKKKVRSSTFNQHILDLETKYLRLRSSFRLKETLTQASNVIIIDDQSVEQQTLSRPRKKVKKEQKNPDNLKQPKLQTNTNEATRMAEQSELYNKIQNARKFYWDMVQLPQFHPQYGMPFNGVFPYYGLDMIMWYNMQNQNNLYVRQLMPNNVPIFPQYAQSTGIRPNHAGVQNFVGAWPTFNMNG